MISVVTITYKRRKLLEEAINSFILQDVRDCEMIILNDVAETKYTIALTQEQQRMLKSRRNTIRLINEDVRYPNLLEKLRAAFSYCKYEHMYRLDDDDLLAETSLKDAVMQCANNHGYDIYRSKTFHYFNNNIYEGEGAECNTGNIYTKKYINGIDDWSTVANGSHGEDQWLTFHNDANIFNYDPVSMIYRWGMETYHVTVHGNTDDANMVQQIDNVVGDSETGSITLRPSFEYDYYQLIKDRA